MLFTSGYQMLFTSGYQAINNDVSYPLYTALLSDSRWIGNPINRSSTSVSVSPSCLSAHFFNHTRFSESNCWESDD